MTTQEAQDVVKAVYPQATCRPETFAMYKFVVWTGCIYLGEGIGEHAAWLSAASQITGKKTNDETI